MLFCLQQRNAINSHYPMQGMHPIPLQLDKCALGPAEVHLGLSWLGPPLGRQSRNILVFLPGHHHQLIPVFMLFGTDFSPVWCALCYPPSLSLPVCDRRWACELSVYPSRPMRVRLENSAANVTQPSLAAVTQKFAACWSVPGVKTLYIFKDHICSWTFVLYYSGVWFHYE